MAIGKWGRSLPNSHTQQDKKIVLKININDVYGKHQSFNFIITFQFSASLIGPRGIILSLIDIENSRTLSTQNPLQICLIALKCVICCMSEDVKDQTIVVPLEIKEQISLIVVKMLMKGSTKSQDEFLYCKVCIF